MLSFKRPENTYQVIRHGVLVAAESFRCITSVVLEPSQRKIGQKVVMQGELRNAVYFVMVSVFATRLYSPCWHQVGSIEVLK